MFKCIEDIINQLENMSKNIVIHVYLEICSNVLKICLN